jgi:beta-galactosidase
MTGNKLRAAMVILLFFAGAAVAELFHEQPSVTSYSTYSNRCFIVNGKPTYILAGELEYWRIPKELWRDRLMRVKRAGYNAITFYVYWSLHEPIQGQWHFEDNLDLDAWLKLIKELGMYAIARVGPYICAEVDLGGFPAWLVDVSNIKFRGNNAPYLQYVDTFYEKIFGIVTKNQIHKGGSVIMVQIENEYYPANAAYETHLNDKAKSLGMEVPFIWSMEINSGDYDPGVFPNLGKPCFVSELWVGWIGLYGDPKASDNDKYIKNILRMIFAGTGGVSVYMAHGGTNFGYTSAADQRVTNYDYGAQIGELGQLRSAYYATKQGGLLAETFSPLVANSTNGASEINSLPTGLTGYVHTGTAGKAAFVMNGSTGTSSFQVTWKNKGVTVPSTGSWSLQPSRFAHFLADIPITSNINLDYSATGVLFQKKFGTKNYLVLYGTPGNSGGDIAFVYKNSPATAPASPWTWNAAAKRASMRFNYPTADTVDQVELNDGNGQTVNMLIVNNNMSNKTWLTDSCIVSGADFVDENDNLQFTASGGKAFLFSSGAMQTITQAPTTPPGAKAFSGWSWIASPEVGASYNDATWKSSSAAQTMPSYGWPNGYGWYRATYNAATAGTATLKIPNLQGSAFIFVNGTWAGTSTTQAITLKQGANSIAILVSAAERPKLWNMFDYYPPDSLRSGIWGNVTINDAPVSPWRFRGGFEGVDESGMMGTISAESWTALLAKTWSTATPPNDNVARLWRMDFAYTPPANGVQTWTLNGTVATGTQGVVWLNGHCLGRQITNQPGLFVPECWLKANNTFIVLTQQGGAPQGYSLQPVEYRAIAKLPFVGTVQKGKISISNTVQQKSILKSVVVSGRGLSLPQQYTGKDGSVAIYDLRGHLIGKVAIKGGKPADVRKGSIPNGVFITKFK